MTACGTTPEPETQLVIRDRYIVPTPDESLRQCKPRPPKPTLTDDTDTAVLITDLDERGEDCSSKLRRTWQSIDEAAARAQQLNQNPQP